VIRQSSKWLAAGLAMAAVLLSGCSEKQEANDTLPNATSSPLETTPELPPLGPEDLPMPEEARTQDAAGVEAFVRYYFDLLNRSLTDMDPQHLRFFAEAGCDVCERIASETDSDAAEGYSYRGGALTIPGDISVTMSASGEAQSAFIADQAPMTVLDSAGTPVPDLVFDGEDDLSSGTVTVWDESSATWKLMELTLG
jgi:hypothetical protein